MPETEITQDLPDTLQPHGPEGEALTQAAKHLVSMAAKETFTTLLMQKSIETQRRLSTRLVAHHISLALLSEEQNDPDASLKHWTNAVNLLSSGDELAETIMEKIRQLCESQYTMWDLRATKLTLPHTFVFDRVVYGGGATNAALFGNLFSKIGGLYQNYHDTEEKAVRHAYFDPAHTDPARRATEEKINFIWGISLERRMINWPKPIKYITVLRDPVLRFISIALAINDYPDSLECSLWEGECSFDRLEHYVDNYASCYAQWNRSQFCELLNKADYGKLEWRVENELPTDYVDPLHEVNGISDVIKSMDMKFSDIYILELQEESAFCFAKRYGFDSRLLVPRGIARHSAVPRWDEHNIPERVLKKIEKLTERERTVYDYFRYKFELEFALCLYSSSDFLQEYLDLKARALVAIQKLRRHQRYLPKVLLQDKSLLATLSTMVEQAIVGGNPSQ